VASKCSVVPYRVSRNGWSVGPLLAGSLESLPSASRRPPMELAGSSGPPASSLLQPGSQRGFADSCARCGSLAFPTRPPWPWRRLARELVALTFEVHLSLLRHQVGMTTTQPSTPSPLLRRRGSIRAVLRRPSLALVTHIRRPGTEVPEVGVRAPRAAPGSSRLLSWGSKDRLSADTSAACPLQEAGGFHRSIRRPCSEARVRRLSASVGTRLPRLVRVPSLSFLPTSTACSTHRLAGLLHPATGHEVRRVFARLGPDRGPGPTSSPALHPSERSPRQQLLHVTVEPCPPAVTFASPEPHPRPLLQATTRMDGPRRANADLKASSHCRVRCDAAAFPPHRRSMLPWAFTSLDMVSFEHRAPVLDPSGSEELPGRAAGFTHDHACTSHLRGGLLGAPEGTLWRKRHRATAASTDRTHMTTKVLTRLTATPTLAEPESSARPGPATVPKRDREP